jgi:hypothetical protein
MLNFQFLMINRIRPVRTPNHENVMPMKQISVSYIKETLKDKRLDEISGHLNSLEKHPLVYAPWAAYPYRPTVHFAIVHGADGIFLKYFVEEKTIRAASTLINGPVWEDACVEFFLSFEEGRGYYNFEFNCTGNLLAGFGKEKTGRELLPEEKIAAIQRQVLIRPGQLNRDQYWELTVVIPHTIFIHHSFSSLRGKQSRANFYKCGDLLPIPHFLSWADITAPAPNFHLPEFFGSLLFE